MGTQVWHVILLQTLYSHHEEWCERSIFSTFALIVHFYSTSHMCFLFWYKLFVLVHTWLTVKQVMFAAGYVRGITMKSLFAAGNVRGSANLRIFFYYGKREMFACGKCSLFSRWTVIHEYFPPTNICSSNNYLRFPFWKLSISLILRKLWSFEN